MSGNGEKPNNELYALNDMLEGVEPAEESLDDILAEVYGRKKPEPQPEAPEPAPEEAASTESASETETVEVEDEVVPIQAWQAGETRTIHVPPVVRDDDADQPDVLSDPEQKRRGKKGKVVAFPGVQTPAEPPKKAAPSPWKEPDAAALPQEVLDAVFADVPNVNSDEHRPDGFLPSKRVKAKEITPAAPDRREDYRAKSEPEETGERLQDEKESRLSRWKSDMERFADSMFSQAASTDEDTEMAEKYIPGTDEEVTYESESAAEDDTGEIPAKAKKHRTPKPRPVRPPAEDIPPQKLSRRYFAGLNFTNRRVPLLVLLSLLNTYLAVAAELSLPLPALLTATPKVAAIAELIVFGAAAVLSFDIILKGFHTLKEHLFTLHTLGSISILLTLADAIVYCFIGRAGSAPYSAPGTLLLLCLTWGYYDKQVANYRACRQAAYAGTPYRITKDEKLWNSRDTFTKEPGDSHGFGSQLQAPTEADFFQSRTAPILLLAALLLAFLASVGRGRPENFLWCAAVMSLSVCPLSALLGYGQPWLRLTRRMEKNGCAVAGWPGVKAAAGPGGVLISDTDLFPTGTIQFNGIKVYGDISLEKLAGCAASLIRTSGSCLTDLFDGLLRTQGGFYRKVEDFQCYEAGGLSGTMRGEQVMVGTASFMKVMDVPLPQDLKVNNAIFCAIDGSLRGIFALNYAKTASVRPAVSALLHTKLVPVLAPRDFNITPAMVRQKLKVPVERMEYPPVERRLELTEPGQEHSETLCALLNRDTVEAYSAAIVGCRRLRTAVRSNCILGLIASLAGLVLGYYLTTMQAFASLTPGNVLIFLALWLIPTLLVNGNVNRY